MLASRTLRASRVASARTMASVTASDLNLPEKYGHFINGEFVEPASGEYFDNVSPVDGQTFIKAARGNAADIDRAVDAANAAYKATWSKTSVTERSNILLKIADKIEANLDRLAKIETLDNGKAVRETMAADLPLVIDHFRYFAGVIRGEEGTASELDANTVSLCIQEPLGVVGQIIPPICVFHWRDDWHRRWRPRSQPGPSFRGPSSAHSVMWSVLRSGKMPWSRCGAWNLVTGMVS